MTEQDVEIAGLKLQVESLECQLQELRDVIATVDEQGKASAATIEAWALQQTEQAKATGQIVQELATLADLTRDLCQWAPAEDTAGELDEMTYRSVGKVSAPGRYRPLSKTARNYRERAAALLLQEHPSNARILDQIVFPQIQHLYSMVAERSWRSAKTATVEHGWVLGWSRHIGYCLARRNANPAFAEAWDCTGIDGKLKRWTGVYPYAPTHYVPLPSPPLPLPRRTAKTPEGCIGCGAPDGGVDRICDDDRPNGDDPPDSAETLGLEGRV